MTLTRMFLLTLFAVLATVVAVNLSQPATAMTSGPYQLMRHSNPAANAGVFRVDTSTGGVSYCYISNNNDLNCTREVR